MAKRKRTEASKSLSEMDVDEFMKSAFNSSDEDESTTRKKSKKSKSKKAKDTPSEKNSEQVALKQATSESEAADHNETKKSAVRDHKESLAKLKEKDSSFYNFLKEHDADLLNFDDSSGDEMDEDDQVPDTDDEPDDDRKLEKEIEIDQSVGTSGFSSDEDDVSDSDEEGSGSKKKKKEAPDGRPKVTMKMVKSWETQLQGNSSKQLVGEIVEAFRAAVERTGAKVNPSQMVVEDGNVFGAVLKLCFTDLLHTWHKVLRTEAVPLGLGKAKKEGKKSSKRGKFKDLLKRYLTDVIRFLPEIQDSGVLFAACQQVRELSPFFGWFPRLARIAIRELCRIWSSKPLRCRKIAMSSIMRILETRDDLMDAVIKRTYFVYVNNTKLINEETWPVIRYMQDSFTKLCAVDTDVTYRHAFLYVRQLAIHLRNATIAAKKDLLQTVYNWQSIQSMYLWSRVLRNSPKDSLLQQLQYPLIQIVIGTAKLVPTMSFYPLHYHCAKILLGMMKTDQDSVFTPATSIMFGLISNVTWINKKHSRNTVKPFRFEYLIKLSKSHLEEKETKDALINAVEELLIEFAQKTACSPAFPELTLHLVQNIKAFCKKCKIAAYTTRLKGIVSKLEEQREFVTKKRAAVPVDLSDPRSLLALSRTLRLEESPLVAFYRNWRTTQERQRQMRLAQRKEEEKEEDKDTDEDRDSDGDDISDDDEEGSKKEFDWENVDESTAFRGDRGTDVSAAKKVKIEKFEPELGGDENEDKLEDFNMADFK